MQALNASRHPRSAKRSDFLRIKSLLIELSLLHDGLSGCQIPSDMRPSRLAPSADSKLSYAIDRVDRSELGNQGV